MRRALWYVGAAAAAVSATLFIAAPANAATAIEYGPIAALIATV